MWFSRIFKDILLLTFKMKQPWKLLPVPIFVRWQTEKNSRGWDTYFPHTIYIYIYMQHFFVNTNFIKHNRHFMSRYFLLDQFKFPYYFYRIRGELIYVLSIVVCIPSTFCPTLGHHQRRIYYKNKSYITFVIDPPLMMAQSRAESTRDTYNYGQYINQSPPRIR